MTNISRRSAVEPFHAMDILAEATRRRAAGHDVISLAVGQPSHPAPAAALAAARAALDDGRIGYTDALGAAPIRAAIARHYADYYGVDIDPARVVVTTGSSAGFNLAFLTLFDAGDRVAITRPGYPAYRNILKALGLEVIEIAVGPETGFTLTPEALEAAARAHGRIAGVLLASPANPTGTVTSPQALQALVDHCEAAGITFISDEIYHRLNFSGDDVTALSLTGQAVVINSFSKYYCMTGWRIGWMVVPEDLARPIERVAQSLYISPPGLSQVAAAAAFAGQGELDPVREGYRRNRDFLRRRLPEIGFAIASPMDGAFYAYVDASQHTNDTMNFARTMLAETNVAATPGLDFDPVDGHRTMRFSYAGSEAEIVEAVARLEAWLKP